MAWVVTSCPLVQSSVIHLQQAAIFVQQQWGGGKAEILPGFTLNFQLVGNQSHETTPKRNGLHICLPHLEVAFIPAFEKVAATHSSLSEIIRTHYSVFLLLSLSLGSQSKLLLCLVQLKFNIYLCADELYIPQGQDLGEEQQKKIRILAIMNAACFIDVSLFPSLNQELQMQVNVSGDFYYEDIIERLKIEIYHSIV